MTKSLKNKANRGTSGALDSFEQQTQFLSETTMTQDEKREELRQKIEAGEARHAERSLGDYAADLRDGATNFVKDHPVATVAGGVALGILIASFTRPGRRVGRRAGERAGDLLATIAELGALFGAGLVDKAGDAARVTGDTLEDFGDTLGDTTRSLRRSAGHRAAATRDKAQILTRSVGKKTSRAIRDLRN